MRACSGIAKSGNQAQYLCVSCFDAPVHPEIGKYYQSTFKTHAEVQHRISKSPECP